MEDYLVEELAEVVTRVKEVLWDLPGPVRTPPEAFFDIDNLWKIEIPSTCRQSIEYVCGVMLLIDQGLNRPAAALSRSIHECYIRFEYLSDHEEELPDWFHWRKSHDYHATRDTLRHFARLSEADTQRLQEGIKDVEDLLGGAPSKPTYPWKSPTSMLQYVASSFGPEAYGPLYRQLIADPSEYVHIHGKGWSILARHNAAHRNILLGHHQEGDATVHPQAVIRSFRCRNRITLRPNHTGYRNYIVQGSNSCS